MYYYDSHKNHDSSVKDSKRTQYLKELSEMLEFAEDITKNKATLLTEISKKTMNLQFCFIFIFFLFFSLFFSLFNGLIIDKSSLYFEGIAVILCFSIFMCTMLYYYRTKDEINEMKYELDLQEENLGRLINAIYELYNYLLKDEIISPFELFKLDLKLKVLKFKTNK